MDLFIDYIMRDFSLLPPCRCTLLDITQRMVVMPYRRFETTYRYHL